MVNDPSLWWFSGETKYRAYLTNCKIGVGSKDAARYYLSLDDCSVPEELPPRHKNEDERRLKMAWENHSIICRAEKIVPGLYLLVE